MLRLILIAFALLLFSTAQLPVPKAAFAAETSTAADAFKTHIQPFLQTHCVDCHNAAESKGKVTLDDLQADLAGEKAEQRWEKILRMLESGEMPPEDSAQPAEAERKKIIKWIDRRLLELAQAPERPSTRPVTRRLTNLEYQNTMRDLLGFQLKLIEHLPEDPVKPYKFNNTAEFMLLGPEQMDRYLECARRAMASAIVDPQKPKISRTEKHWKHEPDAAKLSAAEIGVYGGGGGRLGAAQGMNLKDWPKTGEFRLRVKASAVLPEGYHEVPLRLVMGYGEGTNIATRLLEPIGTVRLTNPVDKPQVFELRGRIENFPVQPGMPGKKNLAMPQLTITPQNLFDNGELNDHRKSAFDVSWNLEVPRVVLESLEFEAPLTEVWPPRHHTDILFDSPLRETNQAAYVREVLRRFMTRAYRRPVTAEELDRLVKVHSLLTPDFPVLEDSLRETLAIVLISPQFLYHTTASDIGTHRQYELASRLSYFLWASMPDVELLKLAEEGQLAEPAVIAAQVRRMLEDKRAHDFVNNFTTQWLSLGKLKTVSINQDLFPRFLYIEHVGERKGTEVLHRPTIRDYMHAETVGFIGELIKRNASVLNIVDSDFALLNQPLAVHYVVAGVEGNELRPVTMKPEQHLGGLLTQGSILIGNSTGSAPHPIYRAVWLREAILGEEVRPPPAEVPALADSAGDAAAKAVTIKELLRQHRQQESCNVCHASLDPWGIPFEHYNSIGKYQPFVPKAGARVRGFNLNLDRDLAGYGKYLDSINTIKVDAAARVPRGPEIDGLQELKRYLLSERRDDIARNVVRKLLAYALSRELTARDRNAVDVLCQQAEKNDYKFQDLIVAICQSEAFRGNPRKE